MKKNIFKRVGLFIAIVLVFWLVAIINETVLSLAESVHQNTDNENTGFSLRLIGLIIENLWLYSFFILLPFLTLIISLVLFWKKKRKRNIFLILLAPLLISLPILALALKEFPTEQMIEKALINDPEFMKELDKLTIEDFSNGNTDIEKPQTEEEVGGDE